MTADARTGATRCAFEAEEKTKEKTKEEPMLIRRADMKWSKTRNCHGGRGELDLTEVLAEYGRKSAGFRHLHDDILEPGATIGEHTHEGDEEIYFVLEGRGTMIVDGVRHEIGPGDAAITRSGHSHGLENGPDAPMRLLVICANV